MIPRFKPALGLNEILAALSTPRKNDIVKFEQDFADLMGQAHALAFPYGRTGLILLLEALGLKNKEIICPAYTCVVVPHAITFSKNRPVFIDCAPGEFNMDLDKAETVINENTGAIIATSIFGYPVDLDRLDKIKKRYPHIFIIQDCAHSFAAEWKGRPVQREGIAAIFGLNISKLLTSIFGGMITTDDSDLYKKLKQIRDQRLKKPTRKKSLKRILYLFAVYPAFWEPVYGVINKLERSGLLNKVAKYYDEAVIDMPEDYLEGMTRIEARVGKCNIARYENIIRNRCKLTDSYLQKLKTLDLAVKLPPRVEGATYSHFVVQVDSRQKWLQWGIKHGIQFGWIIEYNIPEMTPYINCNAKNHLNASYYSKKTINIPLFIKVRDRYICKKIIGNIS